MGWESTVFVAKPGVLASFFPGWKPALDLDLDPEAPGAPPVTQTSVNPFTNEVMTRVVETVEYQDDDEYSPGCDWDRYRKAALPDIAQELSMGGLAKVARALGLEEPACRRALSEPPDSETIVMELVPRFVEALATSSLDRHAALGREMRPDLDDDNARALLARLAELARKARETNARVYLVEET